MNGNNKLHARVDKDSDEKKSATIRRFNIASDLLYDVFGSGLAARSQTRSFLIAPVRATLSGLQIDWNYGDPLDRAIPDIEVEGVKQRKIIPVTYKPKVYSTIFKVSGVTCKLRGFYESRCRCYMSFTSITAKHYRKSGRNKVCNVCADTKIRPIPLSEFYGV
jgi:hypothetical protein